ncbi:MAG TPA: HD domain-containing phosphohydrolase, partial [Usitatibacter sp.]|nr:HD domain-containing phosphohydrolase [Usitatibacter sp.]
HAARLHDIGKFAIPDAILLKPGALDEAEMKLMRTHTTIGGNLLDGRIPELSGGGESIARFHHEHWDGRGYPEGRSRDAIPLAARIAALADVYDALTHERPYKRAWTHEASVEYIGSKRSTHFDPRLTDIFLELMGEVAGNVPSFTAAQEGAAAESPYVLSEARASAALA